MATWILKALLPSVFLGVFTLVVSGGRFCSNPTPPMCTDDCNGNGYYLNEDETECIQCPTCPAGQELNKACGNGMNGDAVCIPCGEGYFSTSTSRQCSPCTTCINTIELETCQVTQDRVCGDCLPGFARSFDRFSADPNACPNRCSDLPRDAPQCRDWWSEQGGGPVTTVKPLEPAHVEQPVPVEPLDYLDACEPTPPRCIDPCYDGNYYLDYDGLCKACLQCQPGEELNKVCGRGKNGDAHCRRCPEGTFSVDGIGRCTPCRICVNTVATECTAIRDSECGECLPGYYQDADGFFPDKGACPNKCMECPTTIPQCQEWCESKEHSEEVTMSAAQPIGQDAVSPQAMADLQEDATGQNAVLPQAVAGFQNDANGKEINDEAGSTSANHASYTIFTVLPSLLSVIVVIIVILITVLVVFRHFSKRSNASIRGSPLLPRPSGTPSPGSLHRGSPSTVYRPTTYDLRSNEDQWGIKHNIGASNFQNLTGIRPISGSSVDSENWSSAASTPTMNLNRHLAYRDLRGHTERQIRTNDSSRSIQQHQPHNPGDFEDGNSLVHSASSTYHAGPLQSSQSVASKPSDQEQRLNERSGYFVSSSDKAFTGKESGTLNLHEEDKDGAPGSQVRRRSSGKIYLEKNSGTVYTHAEDQDEVPGSQVRRRSSGKVFTEMNSRTVHAHAEDQDGVPGSQVRRRSSGKIYLEKNSGTVHPHIDVSKASILPEQEPVAELFPPDSSSDYGHTSADTNSNKTADEMHEGRPSGPNTSSRTTATDSVVAKPRGSKRSSLGVLPENSPTEITPEKKSFPNDEGNSGDKSSKIIKNTGSRSPGEPSVTININMTTNDIGNFQVGDVHSSYTYPHQSTTGSENHDEGDEADEGERLLNLSTSESDPIPEPHNHTCCDEDDDELDEKDKLLNPISS